MLLDRRADVNAKESFGFTPLHLASYLGHRALTRVLLDCKASVQATNNEGSTALHLAAKQNNTEVVKLLLNAKDVDLLAKDNAGKMPIQVCEDTNGECFNLLKAQLVALKQQREGKTGSSMEAPAEQGGANAAQTEKLRTAVALLTSNIDLERARVAGNGRPLSFVSFLSMLTLLRTDLEKKLQALTAESQKWKGAADSNVCKQCTREPRGCVFLPCMHMHYCATCSSSMLQCASCQMHIEGKVPATLN